MSHAPETLLLDMLEWLARAPRTYDQTMEAWRTSCPRLTVWEDAAARDFIRRENNGGVASVVVTAAGHRYLNAHGR